MRGLSDEELLYIIMGRRVRDLPDLVSLSAYDATQLRSSFQLTPSQARKLAAVIECHRRLARSHRPQRPRIRTPEDAFAILGPLLAHLEVERLYCLCLDPRTGLIGEPILISQGDIDGTDAGPRAFFRAAVRAGAASAIAVHNHPTGDVEPSTADRVVTRRMVEAGKHLDLNLVDHVIIAGSTFCSLRRDHPSLWTTQ